AISVAAAKLAAGPNPPKRTIRVALFGAEEMDFAREAFEKAHKADAPKMVVIGEADIGADRAWAVAAPPCSAGSPQMRTYAAVVTPISVEMAREAAQGSGDDVADLVRLDRVPAVSVRQDASRYFDWHHTAEDTLDKVDPAQLGQAVATWASFVYI